MAPIFGGSTTGCWIWLIFCKTDDLRFQKQIIIQVLSIIKKYFRIFTIEAVMVYRQSYYLEACFVLLISPWKHEIAVHFWFFFVEFRRNVKSTFIERLFQTSLQFWFQPTHFTTRCILWCFWWKPTITDCGCNDHKQDCSSEQR